MGIQTAQQEMHSATQKQSHLHGRSEIHRNETQFVYQISDAEKRYQRTTNPKGRLISHPVTDDPRGPHDENYRNNVGGDATHLRDRRGNIQFVGGHQNRYCFRHPMAERSGEQGVVEGFWINLNDVLLSILSIFLDVYGDQLKAVSSMI